MRFVFAFCILLLIAVGVEIWRVPASAPKETGRSSEERSPNVAAPPSTQPPPSPAPKQPSLREAADAIDRHIRDNFQIKTFTWSKGIGVATATLVFDNQTYYVLKDVTIRCDFSAPSGTKVDSSTRTIFQTFEAKTNRTIKDFNLGFVHSQAAQMGCGVTDFKIVTVRTPPSEKSKKSK